MRLVECVGTCDVCPWRHREDLVLGKGRMKGEHHVRPSSGEWNPPYISITVEGS